MATDHRAILLQEYNSCDTQVSRIDTLIWQTASVIFPITLAGLAFFGSTPTHTITQFVIVSAVALGSISLLTTWYLLSRQWYAYQAIAFYRMREIEAELGMFHYRYSFFMRRNKNQQRRELVSETINALDEKEQIMFQKVDSYIGKFPRVGLKVAIAILTFVFVFGWISLLVREFVLSF